MSGFSKVGLFLVAPLGNYFRWRFFVAIFFACIIGKAIILRNSTPNRRWRPYRAEYTGSLPNSEVNRRRARLVLVRGTDREDPWVPPAFYLARKKGGRCRFGGAVPLFFLVPFRHPGGRDDSGDLYSHRSHFGSR